MGFYPKIFIGNYFHVHMNNLYGDVYVKLASISADGLMVFIYKDAIVETGGSISLFAIPLTEEILDKCSNLKKNNLGVLLEYKERIDSWVIQKCNSGKFKFNIFGKFDISDEMQYVHELQNEYRRITNKHLDIVL